MIDASGSAQAAASEAPEEAIDPELAKQQAQLAQFNEYIHQCRDLYKSDPTMVSFYRCLANLFLMFRRDQK